MSIRKGTVKIGNITKIVSSAGGIIPTGTLNIINNGDYDVSKYANAKVNVTPTLQDKTVSPSTNFQTITPDSGYDGLSSVGINAVDNTIDSNIKASNIKSGVTILGVSGTLHEGITPSGTLSITSNGTRDVTNYASVNVNVPVGEDLSSELSTYETYLSAQEVTIDQIISELAGKAAGGVDTAAIEDSFILHTVSGDYVNNRIDKVGFGAFYEDTALTGFIGLNVITVADYAFRGCSNLISLNLPIATKMGGYALYQASVPDLYLPEVTTMGSYTFGGSNKIKTITLPKLLVVQSNGFRQNTGVTKVDLGACTTINSTGFYNCTALVDLIIRTNAVATLANTNALSGCSKLTNIYVPDDLVDDYKAATNWSTYTDKFKPLSELEG